MTNNVVHVETANHLFDVKDIINFYIFEKHYTIDIPSELVTKNTVMNVKFDLNLFLKRLPKICYYLFIYGMDLQIKKLFLFPFFFSILVEFIFF